MKKYLYSLTAIAAFVAAVLVAVPPSVAQVPAIPPPPYNVSLGALITNTARAAGTVNSAQQNNLAYSGVICTFNQTAVTSTPSTVIKIQAYDSASGQYLDWVSSGAVTTALNTPTPIVVAPGVQTSSLPTGMVALNAHLPRFWRVVQTITGGSVATTGTVGCDYLK